MYKKLIYISFLLFFEPVWATELYNPEWVMYFQDNVINRQASQSVIFNALNLNNEQRKQFIEAPKQDDKEFKRLLTGPQKAKYSMIKKLQRHDLKKDLHPADYYKKNPQMTRFGDEKLNCESNKNIRKK